MIAIFGHKLSESANTQITLNSRSNKQTNKHFKTRGYRTTFFDEKSKDFI